MASMIYYVDELVRHTFRARRYSNVYPNNTVMHCCNII